MQRKRSLHINRGDNTGFDFLKTNQIPTTPQVPIKRQKKMFLTLYRTLKKNSGKETNFSENLKNADYQLRINERESMLITSLVPIPFRSRPSTRASNITLKKSSIFNCRKIKVSIQSKKSTPYTSLIEDTWT